MVLDVNGNSITPRYLFNGAPPGPTDPARLAQALKEHEEYLAAGSPEARRARTTNSWETICPGLEYRAADQARLPLPHLSARVLAWQYQRRGLLCVGQTGTGKSMTCWILMRRLFAEGYRIQAFDGLGWTIAAIAAFRDSEQTEPWISRMCRVDVLFLDDIFRGNFTGSQEIALWGILERRAQAHKPVIVATNATGESMTSKHGDLMAPIIRRLREFCDCVTFEE
jgi:DNA replication protein DnaC